MVVLDTVTTSRDRRATAGKRMTVLVGKAQEEDEEFWGHDTWASDNGEASEDESYNVEEEAEVNKVDVFDSDFNDSEEEEDDENNEAEELELRRQEKRQTTMAAAASKYRGGAARRITIHDQSSSGETYNKVAEYFHPTVVEAARIQYRTLFATAVAKTQTAAATAATSSTARSLILKKKSKEKQKRSVTGTGWNAGIVLNLPNSAEILSNALQKLKDMQQDFEEKERQSKVQQQVVEQQEQQCPLIDQPHRIDNSMIQHDNNQSETKMWKGSTVTKTAAAIDVKEHSRQSPSQSINEIKVASYANEYSPAIKKSLRTLRAKTLEQTPPDAPSQPKQNMKALAAPATSTTATTATAPPDKQKLDRKHVPTQEEMLIEAANETEPENERWLLSRQRFAAAGGSNGIASGNKITINKKHSAVDSSKNNNHPVIQRFHSRRGCYNTITFPEMDLIPEFWRKFEKRRDFTINNNAKNRTCVITGQPAKYCDPKTGFQYANLEAYQEIKRLYHHPNILQKVKAENSHGIKPDILLDSVTTSVDLKKKVSRNSKKRPPTEVNNRSNYTAQQVELPEPDISCKDIPLKSSSQKKFKCDSMVPPNTTSSSTISPLSSLQFSYFQEGEDATICVSSSAALDLSGNLPANAVTMPRTDLASNFVLKRHGSPIDFIRKKDEVIPKYTDAITSKSENQDLEASTGLSQKKDSSRTASTTFSLSPKLDKKYIPWVAKALANNSKGDSEGITILNS
jgi:hypothetical protein